MHNDSLILYIYNSVENEWVHLSNLKKKQDQTISINSSHSYADCYLFSNAERKEFMFLSPVTISSEFKDYFESLTGSKVTTITPKMSTPFITKSFMEDTRLFKEFIQKAKRHAKVLLYPYATSSYLYELASELKKQKIHVELPESPIEKFFWTVEKYGGKSGFRRLVESLHDKQIMIPQGTIHHTIKSAIKQILTLYEKKAGVLIKSEKGSGGKGMFMFKRGELPHDSHKRKNQLTHLLTKDLLWKNIEIVVEEFILVDKENPIQFPSIEGKVEPNGKLTIPYACNMLVTKKGNFFGMEIGKNALPATLERKMRSILKKIGMIYAVNGYRGHFDVDMIYAKDKTLYVNESNLRHTGGTDAYKLLHHILGSGFLKRIYAVSKFVDLPKKRSFTFTGVHHILKPILFSSKKKTGLIISSESSILKDHALTYFIVGNSKKTAYLLEKKMMKLLKI